MTPSLSSQPSIHGRWSARRLLSGAVVLGVATGMLLLTAPVSADAAGRCSSTPFTSSSAGHRWYRIPAIVRTRSGALLAFAERRDRILGDLGNFDVVEARSTDRGCHWSAVKLVGNDASNRVSNPVPIVDSSTGKVLLLSVVTPRSGSGGKGKGLYLQTSSDDGMSFSPLLKNPITPIGKYKGGLTGPGHAIQLTVTHKGRLIVPLGYKTSKGLYGAYGIYSDDHGATWRTGFDQQDTSGNLDLIEGTIAELATGDLFISFRIRRDGAKAGTARHYAISKDGGQTLSQRLRAQTTRMVSVQGSALTLRGAHTKALLFSGPSGTDPDLRRYMSIFVSSTGGRTWGSTYRLPVTQIQGSYSDLVQLDSATVGVLYETGQKKWKERIGFESVGLPAILR